MAKQKCGTCRFYEDGRFAGSGWCHHPLRHTTTGAMIVVRRDELACRNGWDQSLWEPGSDETGLAAAERARRNGQGPLPPASAETMLPLLRTALEPRLEGEDVLLSEARIVSEPLEPWPAATRPAPSAGFDPRTAIFRAREAHRERARARAAAARHAAGAEALILPTDPVQERVSETGFDEPGSRATAEADVAHAASAPTLHGATEADDLPEPTERDSKRESEERSADSRRPLGFDDSSGDSLFQRDSVAVTIERQGAADVPTHEVCAPELPAAVERNPALPRTDLPAWFRTELPRICRSCRDFRPSADGQRGWCANAWAFTHSRLVQADEPTPCQSAIGDWWVPADDVWMVAADVSEHGRATPLLDRAQAGEPAKRRRS